MMVGTFALIVYTYPYLGLTFIPIVVFIVSTSTHASGEQD